jgi:hypothetical protein
MKVLAHPKMKTVAAIAALSLAPTLVAAHNYTYLEGGYLHRDYGAEEDGGFRIAGSADVAQPLAVIGEYNDTGDVEQLSAGLLYHTPLNNVIDFNAGATMEHFEVGSRDDTGYGLRAGLRWQLMGDRAELNPEIRYVDVFDDDATSLRLGGLYKLNRELDVQGAVQGGDDDRVEVGLRYNFLPRLAAAR